MSRARRLARADLSAGDIDTVVTVCSTGIATPTLEARVAGKLGFRADVSRVPVFGLGCAGGVSGLSIASRLAQARPGTNVLLVALELCTLAVRHDELTKANVVAASLFGDGAAAVMLRAGDGGATRIEASGEKLWPDTLDIMGWSVDPEGFGVIFQRTIPGFVAEHMGPAVAEMLSRMELSMDDIDRFICHPGGTKVITALERALSLDQGTLDHERDVIADYGNMSAPTVLFVLERALRARPAAAVAADRRSGPASPQAASRCDTPRELRLDHSRAGDAAAVGRTRPRARQHRKAAGARRDRDWRQPLSAGRAGACGVADRAVGLGPRSGRQSGGASGLRRAAGLAAMGPCNARAAMDHAHHRAAGRAAGRIGSLSISCRIPTMPWWPERSRCFRSRCICRCWRWSSRC